MRKMKCGNCGETKHELHQLEKSDGIIVVCMGCENRSKIVAVEPKLSIKWVKGFDGLLD